MADAEGVGRRVRDQHASKDYVAMNDFITVFMFTDTAGNTIGEYQGRVITGVIAIALELYLLGSGRSKFYLKHYSPYFC